MPKLTLFESNCSTTTSCGFVGFGSSFLCLLYSGGGANASIRHDPEINYGANAGLKKAVGYLEPFKQKYPSITWADLIQMASACAIEADRTPEA
eukprot:5443595-Amphidinium_carterae.1